jgi:DsbC/DsbD-like thiol-disulfide interchange protein
MKPMGLPRIVRVGCLLAAAGWGAPATAATSAWIRNPQSAVRLVTPYAAAPRSGIARLGVEFQLSPGWHAYWRNPGSAGFPPTFSSQTPTWRIFETRWPAPSRFDLPGGLVAFGYETEVVYPLRSHLSATGDSVRLVVDVDYLVCEVECVPYRYDLVVDQPLADVATSDSEGEAALAPWEARVPTSAGSVPGLSAAGSVAWRDAAHGELRLAFTGVEGHPDLYVDTHNLLEIGLPERQPGEGLAYRLAVVRKDASRPLPGATDVAWTLTGLERAPAQSVEGRTSIALATQRKFGWRWFLIAAVVAAAIVAFLARRRTAID